MARIVRRNPLTTPRTGIADAFGSFLRSRNSLCAKSTINVYKEIGDRVIIPNLVTLTGDDMGNVTADVLRTLIDNYSLTHKQGGVVFLYRHLKAFINWYWDEYEIPTSNPIHKIKVKQSADEPKKGITREEVDKLLQTAKTKSVFPERDIALLMVLCDTGIRRSSLAGMKMQDVDIEHGEMTVYEKDQRYHTKAFGSATTKALKRYMACLEDVKPDDPFWLCMDGKVLTHVGMREVLRRLCAEAGIDMHHFHDFRRFYALELYNSTHDIYLVSRALDHKDIEVTKRYLHIDDLEDREVARIYSPMDKRCGQTGVKIKRSP